MIMAATSHEVPFSRHYDGSCYPETTSHDGRIDKSSDSIGKYGSLRDSGSSLVTTSMTGVRERDAALGLQYLMHPRSTSPIHNITTFSQSDLATSATSSESITPSDMPEDLLCLVDGCTATFTGSFRRGNRGRHMRFKHTNVTESSCFVCDKTFNRTDARLKHMRFKHPGLDVPGPKPRK